VKSTTYHVEAMDCGAEEQLVRMCLIDLAGITAVDTDSSARRVIVIHDTDVALIDEALDGLGLGSRRTGEVDHDPVVADAGVERRALRVALLLNAALFFGEGVAGWLANSLGLLADALDMGADAAVYALSLLAVGRAASRKASLARASGLLQLGLACIGLIEVVRRFVTAEALPNATTMVVVSLIALAANVATLVVLRRARSGEIHIEASWIFTSNDVKVNALVIVTAGLVAGLDSRIPDLVAGGIIFVIVANGARRILRLAHAHS
jgi:Co/Zn/Cd efflux system component